MLDLTFGEQVKIILSRKGMTIKELAEIIEERTGKKMSRQNLTQRLGRDNFQEQDMRMIADILGCPFKLSILGDSEQAERAALAEDVEPTERELAKLEKAKVRKEKKEKKKKIHSETAGAERDITIGELVDIHRELDELSARKMEEDAETEARMTESAEAEVAGSEGMRSEGAAENLASEALVSEAAEETMINEAEETHWQEDVGGEPSLDAVDGEEAAAEWKPEEESIEEVLKEVELEEKERKEEEKVREEKKPRGWRAYFQRRNRKDSAAAEKEEKKKPETVETTNSSYEAIYESVEGMQAEDNDEEDLERGEVNPYTGHEYETNSVRSHPKRIGYVQVYDRANHQWTDMTEWAFMGYQERKKALLGKDYEPPIYLE